MLNSHDIRRVAADIGQRGLLPDDARGKAPRAEQHSAKSRTVMPASALTC